MIKNEKVPFFSDRINKYYKPQGKLKEKLNLKLSSLSPYKDKSKLNFKIFVSNSNPNPQILLFLIQ